MTGRALKNAVEVDGALAPALTRWDLKVLNAVPVDPFYTSYADRGTFPAGRGLDPWTIARTLRHDDVREVRATLRGLYDRRLVHPVGWDTQRKLQRWVRRPQEDLK